MYKYYSPDTQGVDDASDDSDTDSQLTPFAKLARKMEDITKEQDKGVLKDMLRQGTGNIVPPDGFVTGDLAFIFEMLSSKMLASEMLNLLQGDA